MKVDIQDVLFWMDAIRNSEDRYRTLESFWKGQINSKVWLVENLQKSLPWNPVAANIAIHGGWNGVLASILFNSDMGISHITSLDIDPKCVQAHMPSQSHDTPDERRDCCNNQYNRWP